MKKRLMKSTENKVLTGTLGGIAEYIGIDPTIARVIFVFATLIFEGAPIPLYILLAIIMPKPKRAPKRYEQPYDYDEYDDYEPYERPRPQMKNQRKKTKQFTDDDWSDF